ncbi:MAG: response regulator transcription factor [Sedimentisphaerales bacterium]|nr:response regulator transcription factor [Sedimentisphaerales bacterium]
MKIMIADDHGIVRQGLRSLIQTRLNHEVIGEAEDGVAAVKMAGELRPDIVIMDVTMPNLNGIEATRLIRKDCPQVKVIALSMHPEKHIVKEALEAGASAYVLKSYLFDDLSKAIEAVAAGRRYLSPKITDVVLDDYISSPDQQQAKAKLTARDRQIIQMLSEGKSIKQIAMVLHISPKTADAARRKIMHKLGVTSVADLVKFAVREGITSLEF